MIAQDSITIQKILYKAINYVFSQSLHFIGMQNYILYYSQIQNGFQPNRQQRIFSILKFSLNKQIKLLRRFQHELGYITFMNKSIQFIFQNICSVQIWQIQNSYEWNLLSTLTVFKEYNNFDNKLCDEDDSGYYNLSCACHKLNQNEDLLVIANHQNEIGFWENTKGIWMLYYKLGCPNKISKLQFNQPGNILLANIFEKQAQSPYVLIIQKNKNDRKWIVIENIGTKNEIDFIPTCFLDQGHIIAYANSHPRIVNMCRISKKQVIIIDKLEVNEQIKHLNFVYSQSTLLVTGDNFTTVIKKVGTAFITIKQIASNSKNTSLLTINSRKNLLLDAYPDQFQLVSRISLQNFTET